MDYCDTNILTAFVNKDEIIRRFGYKTAERFNSISRGRNIEASKIARNVGKCIVDRNTLLSDIGNHQPSMAGILTSSNLSNVFIKNIGGEEEGINSYNRACKVANKESNFHSKFCNHNELKSIKELGQNNLNDIRHFGSALKSGSKIFLTGKKKDFKILEKVTDVKIE